MIKKFLEQQIEKGEEFVWVGQQPDKFKDVSLLSNLCRAIHKLFYG